MEPTRGAEAEAAEDTAAAVAATEGAAEAAGQAAATAPTDAQEERWSRIERSLESQAKSLETLLSRLPEPQAEPEPPATEGPGELTVQPASAAPAENSSPAPGEASPPASPAQKRSRKRRLS